MWKTFKKQVGWLIFSVSAKKKGREKRININAQNPYFSIRNSNVKIQGKKGKYRR